MPAQFARHRDYVDANVARGVIAHMAQFKEKPRKCRSCGARWIAHEEKETDVQIAVHMVADALKGEADRLIVVSADTDLSPAVRMIAASASEREVFVASPPGRFARSRGLKPRLELTAGRLGKCLLPETIQVSGTKIVKRPASYSPPD
jgi:uncharacterized LabA/DUF88 family protein